MTATPPYVHQFETLGNSAQFANSREDFWEFGRNRPKSGDIMLTTDRSERHPVIHRFLPKSLEMSRQDATSEQGLKSALQNRIVIPLGVLQR
jgi:hypothetical protein